MNRRRLHLLLLLSASLTLGGCSEDYYGELRCTGIDTLVVHPRAEIQHITVIDNEAGMAGMESLYLGSSGGTRSDFLLEYDFSTFAEDHPDFPDSLIDPDHIRSVALRLQWLPDAHAGRDTLTSLGVNFEVRALAGGFEEQDYLTAPGPAAPLDGPLLNGDTTDPDYENWLYLDLAEGDLVDWVTQRNPVAMVVTAGAGSESGLVAFASLEKPHYGYSFAPTIVVRFQDYSVRELLITPAHDTSTFDQVADLPPDMIHLQTGLQSYPVLTFDIPPLPAESSNYVMYGFDLFADHIDTFWSGSCLELLQLGSGVAEDPADPVLAADLAAAATSLLRICPGGEAGDDPDHFRSSEYPRWKPAPPSVTRLLITFSGAFPGYWRSGAGIYLTQSTFFGPNATAELRPVLLVLTCNLGE